MVSMENKDAFVKGGELDRLKAENSYLRECLRQAAGQRFAMRLDALFRVVEGEAFNGTDFYQECREEIMRALRLSGDDLKRMRDEAGEGR